MYWIVCLIAAVVFLVDLVIKNYLSSNFAHQSIPIIKNILHITVVFNKGAAFGILQGATNLLIYIGIIFIIVFFIAIRKENNKNLTFLISSGNKEEKPLKISTKSQRPDQSRRNQKNN